MKSESEIREAVKAIELQIKFETSAGTRSLHFANLEALKSQLLWVLDEDQTLGEN